MADQNVYTIKVVGNKGEISGPNLSAKCKDLHELIDIINRKKLVVKNLEQLPEKLRHFVKQ
jgi:hypothetical protein